MKNVEIITSQNVVLQYELASLQDRVLAFLLDLVIMVVSLSILSAVFGLIFVYLTTVRTIAVWLVLCLVCCYSLLFETLNEGRSIGKIAMRIQVIKLAGGRATFSDYVARWIFRLIDIYFSFGGLASILIMSSAKSQRIGDIIANTAVVRVRPKINIDLDDLLSIHASNKYIPVYQEARKLQEEDALLIKTTLERYRRFHNQSHAEAVKQLAERVQDILGIPLVKEEKTVFLQTILKDYVVLSR